MAGDFRQLPISAPSAGGNGDTASGCCQKRGGTSQPHYTANWQNMHSVNMPGAACKERSEASRGKVRGLQNVLRAYQRAHSDWLCGGGGKASRSSRLAGDRRQAADAARSVGGKVGLPGRVILRPGLALLAAALSQPLFAARRDRRTAAAARWLVRHLRAGAGKG